MKQLRVASQISTHPLTHLSEHTIHPYAQEDILEEKTAPLAQSGEFSQSWCRRLFQTGENNTRTTQLCKRKCIDTKSCIGRLLETLGFIQTTLVPLGSFQELPRVVPRVLELSERTLRCEMCCVRGMCRISKHLLQSPEQIQIKWRSQERITLQKTDLHQPHDEDHTLPDSRRHTHHHQKCLLRTCNL